VALQGIGQLILVHLRATTDAGLAGIGDQLVLALVGVHAALGLVAALASCPAGVLGLGVGGSLLVLELPVVALLLGHVLDRRPGCAVRPLF